MPSSTQAWLFDAYPHPRQSALVVWVKHGSTTTKRLVPYQPDFCLARDQLPLDEAERLLAQDSRVAATWRDHTALWLRGPTQEVLRVRPHRLHETWAIARDLRRATHTKGFRFFDVDHAPESRWLHAAGLWSLCRLAVDAGTPTLRLAPGEDRWTYDYPNPGLRCLRLAVVVDPQGPRPWFSDPLRAIHLGDEVLPCRAPGHPPAERATLLALHRRIQILDPDVLLTHGGDRFDIPFLLHRINDLGLRAEVRLGRDLDPTPDRPDQQAKSVHTYGRWLYKSTAYYLRGRWHIDLSKKSLDAEADRTGVEGIVYLARVANRRAQDVNRNGAGFALQQMQVDLASDWGVALPWKRNLTEDWKDAATLYAVDRGSQIMVPEPGLYEDVAACDFSGYYPALVVQHNLSSDSLNCTCCPDGPVVPELGYHVCQRHRNDPPDYGHQAEILRRLQPHRRRAKAILRLQQAGAPVPPGEVAKARAIKSEHKALGVVCFGYFRYRNARFGCAEVHQAIQCLGRASMTQTRQIAQAHGFRMVHALTDCAFLHKPGVTRAEVLHLARRVTQAVGVPLEVEGIYRWLVLLPSKLHSTTSPVGVPNRYYGKFEDGTLKVRGLEVRRRSTPPFLEAVQTAMLDVLAQADDAAGFRARIPLALRVAKQAARDLLAHRVAPAELAVRVQATRSVEEYTASTGAKAALQQLREAGDERKPGEFVAFVHARSDGARAGRVVALERLGAASPWFGQPSPTYDATAYVRLLARQCETLLAPFGYDEAGMESWLAGRTRAPVSRLT